MAFTRIEAPSIKELFLSQMEEMILSGELKAGDRLPTERELADAMGISKTVVHEGIKELSRMGFVDVASRKGVYVADYSTTGNLETLFAIIRFRGGMPDRKMVLSLLDARIYLECPALRLVAANRTEKDIEKLKECQEMFRLAIPGPANELATRLFAYRRTVVIISGNCITPLIMNAFFESSITAWADYCDHMGREETYKELCLTTEFLEEGNGDAAASLFTDCVEKYKAHIRGQ